MRLIDTDRIDYARSVIGNIDPDFSQGNGLDQIRQAGSRLATELFEQDICDARTKVVHKGTEESKKTQERLLEMNVEEILRALAPQIGGQAENLLDAMNVAKFIQKSIIKEKSGETRPSSPEIIRKGFLALFAKLKEACQIAKKTKKRIDLVITALLNDLTEAVGSEIESYKEEVTDVLEELLVAHPDRAEILDAYYNWCKKHKKLERVMKTLEEHPIITISINQFFSSAMEELTMGENDDKDPVRMEMVRLQYKAKPSHQLHAIHYIYRYLVQYKGDYEEAVKVARKIPDEKAKNWILKHLRENLIPKGRYSDPRDQETSAKEMEDFYKKEIENPDTQIKTTRLRIKQATLKQISSQLTREGLPINEAMEILANAMRLPDCQSQFIKAIFIETKILNERDPVKRLETAKALIFSGLEKNIERINFLTALILEEHYIAANKRAIIEDFLAIRALFPNLRILRATAYYLMESEFEEGKDMVAAQMKNFEGTIMEEEILIDILLETLLVLVLE